MRKTIHVLGAVALLSLPQIANAAVVGHWTFEDGSQLSDQTGNFDDIVLHGNASITGGALNIDGTGTNVSGWANAVGYSGPSFVDKTLVSQFSLNDLSVFAGTPLGLDDQVTDDFDSIVFAERQSNRWMAGSSSFLRTQDLSPATNTPETQTGIVRTLAITYDDLDNVAGGDVNISVYRDSILLGSYVTSNGIGSQSNIEVLFGPRHTIGMNTFGALDASIFEARVYDTALSASEIANLDLGVSPVPLPAGLPLLLAGLGAIGLLRSRTPAKTS